MGYDMTMASFKKKSLEEANKIFEKYNPTFEGIYHNYLFNLLYPHDSNDPTEGAKWICTSGINIFRDFFEPKLENDTVMIVEQKTYEKMITWLEEKLKNITLYDVANDEKLEDYEVRELISVYKQIKSAEIDFETEFIVFEHDW